MLNCTNNDADYQNFKSKRCTETVTYGCLLIISKITTVYKNLAWTSKLYLLNYDSLDQSSESNYIHFVLQILRKLRLTCCMAWLANSWHRAYHWGFRSGSMTSLVRLQMGTTMGFSISPRNRPFSSRALRTAHRASKRFMPTVKTKKATSWKKRWYIICSSFGCHIAYGTAGHPIRGRTTWTGEWIPERNLPSFRVGSLNRAAVNVLGRPFLWH